ncbi:MAG: apolipoprotein N-acyltransferase [Sulfurospirillaceae bacterium]|nr:apolipoprotein N-acyltransferase [Sulfurospirillaceae bacterium]
MEVMKLTYLYRLACKSFNKNFVSGHFTTSYIIKGFAVAFCLSIFIFLTYLNFESKPAYSLIAILGFYLLLKSNRYEFFWIGFFIGILWFYWISFSFIYYHLAYLIPIVILGIGLIYGIIFRIVGAFENNIYIKTFLVFAISFIHPFGFNWLKLELSLSNSYFNPLMMTYISFLIAILLLVKLKRWYKVLSLIFLLLATYNQPHKADNNTLRIKTVSMHLNQKDKWDPKYENEILENNYYQIEQAIKNQFDLIILPETAFPIYLDMSPEELVKLESLSKRIDIITGALSYKDDKIYNSTYFFQNGNVEIANKVVLVPFGEEIPLPSFLGKFINRIFFNSSSDFANAKKPHDFNIKGEKFRNAICFEATTDELFENNPKRMVAISNNAWFTPSTEPTLQNLLLKFYSRKYHTIIYHSANGGISEAIGI